MSSHDLAEADDTVARRAIRDLIDGWAHFADRRQPRQQAALFVPDGTVTVYSSDPNTTEPSDEIRGREAIEQSLDVLRNYQHTTHLNGQSTITVDGDTAKAESYCLAHHLWTDDDGRKLMIMSIRYLDQFLHTSDGWLFNARQLVVDWTDTHRSNP